MISHLVLKDIFFQVLVKFWFLEASCWRKVYNPASFKRKEISEAHSLV